uniref:Uncharacterized protein MANES_S042000 n=1 Tax=Rhizophora mucronata TaxID=61149 RepID=A0A2P2LXK8_RHIMU
MWLPWVKSTVKIHETSTSSSSCSSSFAFSTFKDIPLLCTEDPSPQTPKRPAVFHRTRHANSLLRSSSTPRSLTLPLPDPRVRHEPRPNGSAISKTAEVTAQPQRECEAPQPPSISIPGADKRIVVYFTSIRAIRRTFEDCRAVRSILRGFHVSIDERDLSMDTGFLNELQQIFGGGQGRLTLPRVFIGGRYIGGAEEIRQLHECGELKKFVEGLPAEEPGVCDVCGGYRFVLCTECNGSHKLYTEKTGFKSCTACNENGLVRCPSCCCAPLC